MRWYLSEVFVIELRWLNRIQASGAIICEIVDDDEGNVCRAEYKNDESCTKRPPFR